MRRVILAVTGTIAGLVALLSFKSHVPSAPVAATAGGSGGTAASSSPSSSSGEGSPPGGGVPAAPSVVVVSLCSKSRACLSRRVYM